MSDYVAKQIRPLGTGAPIWEHDSSDYPDVMKMPMEDGRVITYRREIQQPEPRVQKCIDLIQLMKKNTYGGYGKHGKREERK